MSDTTFGERLAVLEDNQSELKSQGKEIINKIDDFSTKFVETVTYQKTNYDRLKEHIGDKNCHNGVAGRVEMKSEIKYNRKNIDKLWWLVSIMTSAILVGIIKLVFFS